MNNLKRVGARLEDDLLDVFKEKLNQEGISQQEFFREKIQDFLENSETEGKLRSLIKQKDSELLELRNRIRREHNDIAAIAEMRNRLIKINKTVDGELAHLETLIGTLNLQGYKSLKPSVKVTLRKLQSAYLKLLELDDEFNSEIIEID